MVGTEFRWKWKGFSSSYCAYLMLITHEESISFLFLSLLCVRMKFEGKKKWERKKKRKLKALQKFMPFFGALVCLVILLCCCLSMEDFCLLSAFFLQLNWLVRWFVKDKNKNEHISLSLSLPFLCHLKINWYSSCSDLMMASNCCSVRS